MKFEFCAPRIDLDGNESGTVSEADAASAARDVAGRKAAAAAKKQQTIHPPIEPALTRLRSGTAFACGASKASCGLSDLREAAKRRKAMAMA